MARRVSAVLAFYAAGIATAVVASLLFAAPPPGPTVASADIVPAVLTTGAAPADTAAAQRCPALAAHAAGSGCPYLASRAATGGCPHLAARSAADGCPYLASRAATGCPALGGSPQACPRGGDAATEPTRDGAVRAAYPAARRDAADSRS